MCKVAYEKVWMTLAAIGVATIFASCDLRGAAKAGSDESAGRPEASAAAVNNPTPAVTPKTEKPPEAAMLSQAFASAATAVRPSVVRIDVEREMPPALSSLGRNGEPSAAQLPPALRRFFNLGEAPEGAETPEPAPISGTGSGFVLDAAGDIITNSHVVEDGSKVKVTLFDGQEFTAKVIGKDKRTDVAIVRLQKVPAHLTVARFGDSKKLQVGEWVLAIGSPLGLDQTVTAGIVSGKGRVGHYVQMSGDRIREYIQTDAKINPGNSGGPLVNLEGEVVGINSLIRVGAGGAYGFAVPIDEAYRVAQVLLKDGRIRYPFLGVNLRDVSRLQEDTKRALGGKVPDKGAIVVEVTPASPAARVGLRPGDVIVKMGNRQVGDSSEVVDFVSNHRIGDTVSITAFRGSDTKTFNTQLAEAPSGEEESQAPKLGLSLQTLTRSLADSLGLPVDTHGVAVTDVQPESPAERAGLRAGEVIVEIDHKPIIGEQDATTILKSGSRHLLRVRGIQGFRFVTLSIE